MSLKTLQNEFWQKQNTSEFKNISNKKRTSVNIMYKKSIRSYSPTHSEEAKYYRHSKYTTTSDNLDLLTMYKDWQASFFYTMHIGQTTKQKQKNWWLLNSKTATSINTVITPSKKTPRGATLCSVLKWVFVLAKHSCVSNVFNVYFILMVIWKVHNYNQHFTKPTVISFILR